MTKVSQSENWGSFKDPAEFAEATAPGPAIWKMTGSLTSYRASIKNLSKDVGVDEVHELHEVHHCCTKSYKLVCTSPWEREER